MEHGKRYIYEINRHTTSGVYVRSTPAWHIFKRDNGTEDWIPSYAPVYESVEQHDMVRGIVDAMERDIHVPDVILAPVGSPMDGRR